MSEQEVTFSTGRFHKTSGWQNQVRSQETHGSRKCSVPWQLIVIALGILCTFRLVIFAVLVTNLFQYSQEKYELQETLTRLHQNCRTMKNDVDLKEELLRNKTIECSAGSDLLESLNKEQSKWYRETKTVLDSSQHTGI
ncbi:killer cell lectin-like receptor 5 [Apodemus sylvaticus]|uniref:killer cell lectin-like receptor 5 n=1 Tax=Apodemus sylvaticus TaxID=10129 RepID=UPI0022443076|nr:killer cell lectin-like receptor 5 [Apodemus sylvaticus]